MNIFLKQATMFLNSLSSELPEAKQAYTSLTTISKTAGLDELLTGPTLHNIVTLLTPFVTNYKVNQVLKLLKELQLENKISTRPFGLGTFL